MKFNDKLIELRKKSGWSQEQLGEKLNVTRQTISKWELGQTTPEMEKLIEISNLFKIGVDDLVNENHSETFNIESEDKNTRKDERNSGKEVERKEKNNLIFRWMIVILITVLIAIGINNILNRYIVRTSKDTINESKGIISRIIEELKNGFNLILQGFEQGEEKQKKMEEEMKKQEELFEENRMEIKKHQEEVMQKIKVNHSEIYNKFAGKNKSGQDIWLVVKTAINANKINQNSISVEYQEIESSEEEQLEEILNRISDNKKYEVEVEFDENTNSNKFIIKEVK